MGSRRVGGGDRRDAGGGPRVGVVVAAHAHRVGWHGVGACGDGERVGGGGQDADGSVRPERAGAGRGQHAHVVGVGHRPAEAGLSAAVVRRVQAGGRQGAVVSVVLRDDRAGGGRFGSDVDPDPGLSGRRHVGDQRAQVVHHRGPGRQLRHPDRPHRGRPRSPPGGQLGVPGGHPVGGLGGGARRGHPGREPQPLRDPDHRPGGPQGQDVGRARPGPPVRARPAWVRPASPIACAGSAKPRWRWT